MKNPTTKEFAALRRVWKPWDEKGWNFESFALGFFLGLGYKKDVARDAAERARRQDRGETSS